MPDRERLLAEEAAGAVSLAGVLAQIPDQRWTDPSVTPQGWTPIIVASHVAAWLDECSRVLTAMTDGTWDPLTEAGETPDDVAAMNAEQADRAAAVTRAEAEQAIAAARTRARAAWEVLPEITSAAWSWFEETGPNHYAKHVHDLTAWLSGVGSDPEVGELLQTEAETWVACARLIDELATSRPHERDAQGWSVADVCHHIAGWMDRASAVVAHNAGWGSEWQPDPGRSTDDINAGFLAGSRELTFDATRLELEEARGRLRSALTTLSAPSKGAKRVFFDSTTEHYEEHQPTLQLFTGSDGSVA